MRTSLKLCVAAFAATLLLSAAVGSASARNLSINNQNLRITFSSLEFEANVSIRCSVTVEGSFHTRTMAKVVGSLVGLITRSMVKQEACTNGMVASFNGIERYNGTTPSNTLPWHITYESFTGRLPNIESMQALLTGLRFGIRDTSSICTGQYGTAEDNVTLSATREAGGGITGVSVVAGRNSATLFRRDGGIVCPGSGAGGGGGTVMQLGTTTRLTITLI